MRRSWTLGEQTIHFRLRLHFSGRLDHFLFDLNVVVPISVDDIALFEHGFSWKHDVGFARRVRHELLDDDPKIESAKSFENFVRVRILRDGVPALDPGYLERRIALLEHLPPEQRCRDRDAHDTVGLRRRVEPDGVFDFAENMARQVGEHPAGARFAYIPGDSQKGDDGAHGLAAIHIALHPEAGVDGDRGLSSDELRESLDILSRHASDRGHALRRVRLYHFAIGVESQHVIRNESVVDLSSPDEEVGEPERQRAVRPRARLDEQVGALGGLGAARVDDDQAAPRLERVVDEDGLMDVGLRWILPPHHDELGTRDVRWIRVLVLSQSEPRRLEARGPAEIAIGGRIAAEEPPEIVRHLVEKALRTACRIEENALRAQRVAGAFELSRNGVEGLVPADARVLGRAGSAP